MNALENLTNRILFFLKSRIRALTIVMILTCFCTIKSYAGGTDTIKPVLTLVGNNPFTLEVFYPFIDPGVSTYSPYFTSAQLSGRVKITSNFDDSLLGIYTVTYNLTDSFGNVAIPVTRTVAVVDEMPPVIKLNGPQYDSILVLNTYHDPGFTVSDNYTKTSSIKITTSGTFVSFFKNNFANRLGGGPDSIIPPYSGTPALGTDYRIMYTATDLSGNSSTMTRFIEVYDNIPPVTKLIGPPCIQTCWDSGYILPDLGLTVTDNFSDSAKGQIHIFQFGTFLKADTIKPGTLLTLGYIARDQAGNASIPITRYIEVLPLNDAGCQSGNTPSNNIIDTTICKGSCPTFTAPVSGSSYLWSTGATSRGTQLCINNDTAISVTITNGSASVSYMYNISVTKTTCVWPGDVNGDGIADNNDVLAIGIAYGDSGGKRFNATTNWIGQPCDDWANSFKSGANHKNADCNGDGVVDSTDLAAVAKNYGSVHYKGSGGSGSPSDPPLSISFSNDSMLAGDTAIATITLGTSGKPITNAYGLAFSIPYNFFYVQPGKAKVTLSNGWMGTPGKNIIYFMRDDSANNTIDFAVTRTDHKNISGYGELAKLNITMQDNLGGKTYVSRKVILTPTNVKLISFNESQMPLYAIGDSMVVTGPSAGINNISNKALRVKLYPNPASRNIFIDAGNQEVSGVQLINELGKVVFEQSASQKGVIEIPVIGLSSGIYTVIISTKNGIVARQILKN